MPGAVAAVKQAYPCCVIKSFFPIYKVDSVAVSGYNQVCEEEQDHQPDVKEAEKGQEIFCANHTD